MSCENNDLAIKKLGCENEYLFLESMRLVLYLQNF